MSVTILQQVIYTFAAEYNSHLYSSMKKLFLTAALSATFLPACLAGPVDGVVKDKKTGETLIGSVVQVKGRQDNMTTTGLDGTFTLKELPDQGAVTIIVNYIGYKPREVTIDMAKVSVMSTKG